MELDIKDDQLKKAFNEALMAQLNEETRDKIIQAAIKSVLETKRTGGYPHRETSVLQEKFEHAVEHWTGEFVRDYLKENQEFRARIEEGVREAAEALVKNNDQVRGAIRRAVAAAADALVHGEEEF